MGTWGTGIFQNDIGDDIKTAYVNKLKLGRSNEEALNELLSENQELLKDTEDSCDFWLALSSVMSDYGRLTEEVKNKALDVLDSENEMSRWSGAELNKRKKELDKLREKLLSEPKPEKKVTVPKKYVTSWSANEIYYAKVSDICKSDKEGFIVFLVHDIIEYDVRLEGLGDTLPVTYLKYVKTKPESIEDTDNEPFMPCYSVRDDAAYKFLWLSNGLKKAESKAVLLGRRDFSRPDGGGKMSFDDRLRSMMYIERINDMI
ncbi:hypothetical protein [Ruminococcus flavefaciens]|uniref:DUF4259 domain-containing protein n=1 Tax=Ruminococcus flavefaciens 007c TaxID=1341157 RepID=W7UMD7_RUMFL|nr:hypothetical protein [Ruminococcus flavefaciens]EWM54963.1 hypothetical protein RF007C_02930 [Ruminococcus flavefaciens 007c]